MREILFRGKQRDNNEWVKGALIYIQTDLNERDECYIIDKINFRDSIFDVWKYADEVEPSTIGQFTGYTDKNGKKIFEGDIFHFEDDIIAVVVFRDGGFKLEEYGLRGVYTESGYDECGGGWDLLDFSPIDWYTLVDLEVIGNIYDNPELLRG